MCCLDREPIQSIPILLRSDDGYLLRIRVSESCDEICFKGPYLWYRGGTPQRGPEQQPGI